MYSKLEATWRYAHALQREIAGSCFLKENRHPSRSIEKKPGRYYELGNTLFVGEETHVVDLGKRREGTIPFHTHPMVRGKKFNPPSGEDIMRFIYQRLASNDQFPMFVLAAEGIYIVHIEQTLLDRLIKDIENASDNKILTWKEKVITQINQRIAKIRDDPKHNTIDQLRAFLQDIEIAMTLIPWRDPDINRIRNSYIGEQFGRRI